MYFVDTGEERFVRIPLEDNERIEINFTTISSGGKQTSFIELDTSKKISSIIDIRIKKENVK